MEYYSQLQKYLYNFLYAVLTSLAVYLWGFVEFSFVWVVVGTVVMMMSDQRKERRRRERREARELHEEGEEAFLRSRVELPSWATFPQVERAEWVNSLVGELWPHLEPLAWQVLQARLEPAIACLLAEYHMAGFRFTRLELGEQAPRLEGVSVHAVDEDKVLLDMDIVYEGDLRLSISLVKISAGLSDIRLRGKLRAVLHLVDVVPLVGGVEVTFLQSPHIDFDLHGAANFLDMPGLHGMIRQVVLESIKREVVYPNKLTVVTADQVPLHQMFLPKPTGILKLTIVEAANLPQSDFGGLFSIDPYCLVQVRSHHTIILLLYFSLYQVGSITKTTKRNTGSNPVWNEDFEFPIDFVEEQTLSVCIYDSEKLSDDEYLGTVQLQLEAIKEAQFQDVWFDLESSGKIKIRTCWYDVSQENQHGAARIIAGFIGTIKADGRSESSESSGLQILVETEDNNFSSKVVESDNGRNVFNEGFMLMTKISEKKICLKIIDSENGIQLGKRYLNLWEIKKLPKCLEINTEKVNINIIQKH